VIAEIASTRVDDDGLVFDTASVTAERIAGDADYEGVRATFVGRLATIRIAMQNDIGISDVVTPTPARVSYPTILKQPAAGLLAYNREITGIPAHFLYNERVSSYFIGASLAAIRLWCLLWRSKVRQGVIFVD
jgi:hypothetical protein